MLVFRGLACLEESLINSAHHLGASFSPWHRQQILCIALAMRSGCFLDRTKICTNLKDFILSVFPLIYETQADGRLADLSRSLRSSGHG